MMVRTTKPHRREGPLLLPCFRCKRHCVIAKAQNTPLERVRVLQRKLYLAAKANPKRKFGVLYDKVCREDVLRAAYAQVRANSGAPGIDQSNLRADRERKLGIDAFLSDIRAKLVAKRYKPLPVRRVYIPKADGTQRPLGIPVIADRVVQAAVKIVIEPLFEATSRTSRMASGLGRAPIRPCERSTSGSTSDATGLSMRISSRTSTRFRTTNCCCRCGSKVIDRSVVKLIEIWLKAGVMEEMRCPEGNDRNAARRGDFAPACESVSPLAGPNWERKASANVRHDAHIVRYADDFVILCDSGQSSIWPRPRRFLIGLASR